MIFGLIMSRLWGMIGSMQLIVLLPLIKVNIPGNVQLIYYFINYNMNFQIIPMDLESYGIVSFSKKKAFSREYEEHGYPTKYVLANLGENIINLFTFIGCLILVLIIDKLGSLIFNR